jgi:hypothetical protein
MSIDSFVPDEPDSLAMHKLRRMVALSEKLRTRSGLGYQDLWERGFYKDCSATQTVPLFVIDLNSGDDAIIAGGAQNYLISKGNLFLLIQVGAKPGLSRDNDRRLEAVNLFSGIRRDLAELAAADDIGSEDGTSSVDIRTVTLLGVEETPFEEVGTQVLRYTGVFTVAWGPEEGG